MLRAIVAIALVSGSGFTSSMVTGRPASAQTWAMPLPICPAPITPTRAISGGSASSVPPAGVGFTSTFIQERSSSSASSGSAVNRSATRP